MANYFSAMEAVFDAEMTTAKLLDAVRANVETNITTIDAAEEMENRLSEEAAKFNDYLSTIANAKRQVEQGDITKEEGINAIAPAIAGLKNECAALRLCDVEMDGVDISENEIAMLREYIVGCKDIVAERKYALQNNGEGNESYMNYFDDMMIAEEGMDLDKAEQIGRLAKIGLGAAGTIAGAAAALKSNVRENGGNGIFDGTRLRNSPSAKTANEMYKNAKKMHSLGSRDKAIQTMQNAKTLYEKLLKEAKALGSTATSYKVNDRKYSGRTGEYEDRKYAYHNTVRYFEDRVDACDSYLQAWKSKSDKKSFKEIKKQLTEERRANRLNEKKAIANAKLAAQKARGDAFEFLCAVESAISDLELELSLSGAYEADGADDADGAGESAAVAKASGLGSKIKGLFGKLGKAGKSGDVEEVDSVSEEILETTDQVEECADEVTSEEGQKKMGKVKKIIILSAIAVVVVVGVIGANELRKKGAEITGAGDKDASKKGIKGIVSAAISAVKKAVRDTAVGAYGARAGRAAKRAGLDKERAANAAMTDYNERREVRDTLLQRIAGSDNLSRKEKSSDSSIIRKNFRKTNRDRLAAIRGAKGKGTPATDSYFDEEDTTFLGLLAGMEGTAGADQLPDEDQFEPLEDMHDDYIDDVCDELDDDAVESAISVMLLEDGLDPDEFC